MRNLLVTGGAGFIGSNFARFLLEREPDVRIINLDALTYAGALENLENLPAPDRHEFVRGDICDADLVSFLMRRYEIDRIVNFAAESHVDRSILGPGPFVQTNIVGTFTLLEAARRYWIEEQAIDPGEARFHQVSTDEVYGSIGLKEPAWTEETPYAPNSPYAASKAASDQLVRAYGHTYGLHYTITNSSNNYGPYQFPEKLIPLVIANGLEGKPLPVYGDGQQIRDWLYVEDHCEAIWLVLRNGKLGETYHISAGNQLTNLRVVETVCGILDELRPDSHYVHHSQLIEFVQDRPGHDRRYAMDAGKILRELGWEAKHSLNEGLLETLRWYLDNPDWVEAVRSRPDYQRWMQQNYAVRASDPSGK